MSNLSTLPLQDNFKTTLSQAWDGGTGTLYVASTPSFTFPSGKTTYIVVSPGKSTMQIAEINAYDATAKTLTVSDITLNKGASLASSAQAHAVGAEVIISDNYQFWADIVAAMNTKVDGNTQGFPAYADATARDVAITSPTNGMMIYNTGEGEFQVYQAGAWATLSSGSTQPNASETVAGKVEIATQAEVNAGTETGDTGAILAVTPKTLDARVFNQASLANSGITGEIKIWTTDTAPTNWLICDGASLLRAGTYAGLFAVIGTTYGAADGTHFNVPNMKGKVVVGFNSAETEFDALGETGGEKTHALTEAELPAHDHTIQNVQAGAGSSVVYVLSGGSNNPPTSTVDTGSVGSGTAHNNLQPYIALNYIIRY